MIYWNQFNHLRSSLYYYCGEYFAGFENQNRGKLRSQGISGSASKNSPQTSKAESGKNGRSPHWKSEPVPAREIEGLRKQPFFYLRAYRREEDNTRNGDDDAYDLVPFEAFFVRKNAEEHRERDVAFTDGRCDGDGDIGGRDRETYPGKIIQYTYARECPRMRAEVAEERVELAVAREVEHCIGDRENVREPNGH